MDLYQTIIGPFAEFDFMRYALASVVFLALSAAPVGVFLVMRRMSLVGDALSHAVLPGAAIGYMFAGLSLPALFPVAGRQRRSYVAVPSFSAFSGA